MPIGESQCSIRYEPSVELDRLTYADLTPVNSTLARRLSGPRVYELFFHANSLLTPLRDGRDCRGEHSVLRLRRQWSARLSGEVEDWTARGYVLDTTASGPRGFGEDNTVDKSWVDTPGDRLTGATTRSYRALQEFITGIGGFGRDRKPIPEFGGLYYFMFVDITPRKYRVVMSLAKKLTPDQVQGAMGVDGKPFPAEMIASNAPPDLVGWRFMSHDWIDYTKWLK
jgi:hypothetical protein